MTFLPEPERRARWCTLISVDDHLVEPPHLFEGRLPARLADRAPRVEVDDDGMEYWAYDGQRHYKVGLNAVVGRPREELQLRADPLRRDAPRRVGHRRPRRTTWTSTACTRRSTSRRRSPASPGSATSSACPTPSSRSRSCAPPTTGTSRSGRARTRVASSRARCRGSSTPRSARPRSAPTRRAGFRAVTFPELPERLGLPSLHTGYWDPFLAACEETGTVVCLHVGSSSSAPTTSSDAPADTIGVLFFGWAMFAAVDWLYSRIPVRFPELRICLSEGGIGWVAGLLDRLDHVERYQQMYGTWDGIDLSPAEVLQRNFWFCAIEDRSGLEQRHRIGVDHICLESDYPHQDGTWPDTQEILRAQIGGFPADDVRKLTWENASQPVRLPGAGRGAGRPRCLLSRPWTRRPPVHDRGGAAHPLPGGVRLQRRRPRQRPRRPTRTTRSGSPGSSTSTRPRPTGCASSASTSQPRVGDLAFSPAVNFHARIYETRPDVDAIVHLHSHYVTVLSSTGATVGMYNVVVGALPRRAGHLLRRRRASRTSSVVDALGDKRVVLMKNHGAIVASDSIEHATIEALTLEQCARYHLECVAAGGTEILEAEVVAGKAMYRKHFLPQMWDANLARLRTSDPDLFDAASRELALEDRDGVHRAAGAAGDAQRRDHAEELPARLLRAHRREAAPGSRCRRGAGPCR